MSLLLKLTLSLNFKCNSAFKLNEIANFKNYVATAIK